MTLSLKNITKVFSDKTVFKDFSYDFSETGIYALVGDSGVGKTTLLRIISGLDTDFSGEVIGGGFENVSYAFQEYRLFKNLTALENAMLAYIDKRSCENTAKAMSLLKRLGFSEKEANLYPGELSGGMKVRVALARAILKKSSVLLLDEPTKELDPALCQTVYEIIKEEAKTRLVIIVTHNRDEIEFLNANKITLNAL